jgi:putative FmdB family regulatory protein
MPVYTMKCDDCGKDFEKYLTFKDAENRNKKGYMPCPSCGSKNTRRTIRRSIPVIYKGEGFTKSNGG